jgi:hypothetical protein
MFETEEIAVTFDSSGINLRGTLHKPTGVTHFPGVAFCHGYFQSNKIGPLTLYVQIAHFICISILRGKRKPGGISKKRGERAKSAVEKQVWQGLDGKNAAFR